MIDSANQSIPDFTLPEMHDYRTIGRLITEIEKNRIKLDQMLRPDPLSETLKKAVIGVTGGSGVGKSTFINTLIKKALGEGRKVAVLAIDPMSTLDGGTFLGDRLRLDPTYPERGVFIRSVSSSGAEGDLPDSMVSMLSLLGMIGYDFLIVETIGIGQADSQVKKYVDKLVFIPSIDLVDWVQALKNEALISADIIFVNDRGNNQVQQLLSSLGQILENRNSLAKQVLLHGNANKTLDLEEVYQLLKISSQE